MLRVAPEMPAAICGSMKCFHWSRSAPSPAPTISRESREALGVGAYKLELPRPPSRRDALPRAVDAWFARACAFAVEDRFGDAALQCRELAAALTHQPPQAPARLADVTQPEVPAQKRHGVDPLAETVVGGPREVGAPPGSRLPPSFRWERSARGSPEYCIYRRRRSLCERSADRRCEQVGNPLSHARRHARNESRAWSGHADRGARRSAGGQSPGGVGGRDVEIAPLDDEGDGDGDGFIAQKVTEATKVGNAQVSFGPRSRPKPTRPRLDNVGVGSSAGRLKEAILAATRGTSPFGPQQLDELRRAQKRGVAVDYEAASGDMVFEGEERVGKFATWAIEGGHVVDTK
jgi:hypothetical protein